MLYSSNLSSFNEKLIEIQKTNSNYIDQANLVYVLCTNELRFLRKSVEAHGFKTIEEETYFFKHIKVVPMSYLIHYIEVRSFELRIPKIGHVKQMEYLNIQIDKVNTFFSRHPEFMLYMDNGYTHFDKHYFTRDFLDQTPVVKSYPYYKDPIFNTSHDEVWARIKGLSYYTNYLKEKKNSLESLNTMYFPNEKKIKWTGSYAAFVEFVYGCQAMGYFNDGNIDTNEIIERLSQFLNIEKGNSSRTYNEIKARKGSRIKFFEDVGQKLLQKMEREDGLEK